MVFARRQSVGRAFGLVDQRIMGFAIRRFTDRHRPAIGRLSASGRSSQRICKAVKLNGESAPNGQERVDESFFSARCRYMGTDCATVDAGVAGVGHYLGSVTHRSSRPQLHSIAGYRDRWSSHCHIWAARRATALRIEDARIAIDN
jgi:hypothetical protein